ncbi:MAG: nuclear transport factor 2 family protein [Actinomycetota bacterium]|nr:nuclear transport factor 2 family protein [Actinomycetota bacterium]
MAGHPNVDRLKGGYDAFNAGDMDTLRERITDDVVWHIPGQSPLAGDYKGQEDVFNFFGRIFQETNGTFKTEIHDLLANDEHGVGLVRVSAERGGKSLTQNVVHVFHLNPEGKTTEFWAFPEDTTVADEFWS